MPIRKRTISTMSTKSSKGLSAADVNRPSTPPPLPSSSSALPNASTTPKSVSSSKASDRESLGASPSKNSGLKSLGRKVSHSRPVRMLRTIGSFGSRRSLGAGGQGRRMSSSSLQSMEHDHDHEHDHDPEEEHEHGIEERLSGDALRAQAQVQAGEEDAPAAVAAAVPAPAEHEETVSLGPGPVSVPTVIVNEGENVADLETRPTELGGIVEDVKDGEESEHEQPIEHPSVVILGPGPDIPEAEADAGTAEDTEDTHSTHRPQHSLDHSVSSTVTVVEVEEATPPVFVGHPAELDQKQQVPLIKVIEEQDEAVQTTQDLGDSVVIVNALEIPVEAPATIVEEVAVEPYIVDEPEPEPEVESKQVQAVSAKEAGTPAPAPAESAAPAPEPTKIELQRVEQLEAKPPASSSISPKSLPTSIADAPAAVPAPAPASARVLTPKAPSKAISQPVQGQGQGPSLDNHAPAAVPASARVLTPKPPSKAISAPLQGQGQGQGQGQRPSLDDHAPELHTPPPIPSLTALFTPTPQVRSLVAECARLSWWVAVTAAPSALIYIYHHRRTIFGSARA